MTQNKRGAYVIVGLTVDTPSIQGAIAANDKYVASLRGSQQQIAAVGQAAITQAKGERKALEDLSLAFADIDQRNSLDKLARDAAKGTISTQQLARELDNLAATKGEIAGVANEIERIKRAGGGSAGGGGIASGFGTIRSLSGAAGLLAGNSQVGSGVAAAAGLVTELGAFGVVAGVATLAVRVYTDGLAKSTERVKAFGDALAKAFLGTGEDIQAYIADTQKQIEADKAAREALRALVADAPSQLNVEVDKFANSLDGVREVLGIPLEVSRFEEAVFSQEALNAQIAEYSKRIQFGELALDAYNQAVGTNIVAANNAAAAEERLRKQREETADAVRESLDEDAAFRLHAVELRRSGSSEALRSEVQANLDRVALIDNYLIPSYVRQGLSTLELINEGNKLEAQNKLLTESVLPLVQAREAEAEAVQNQLGVIADSIGYHQQLAEQIRNSTVEQVEDRLFALQEEAAALRQFIPELEKLAPTSADAAKQLEEARLRLAQIGDDYADQMARVLPSALLRAQQTLRTDIDKIRAESDAKQRQIEAERGEKEAEAQRDRDKSYLDAEEKRGEALNKLADDQADARAKIERRSNATITNAVFARNSLAAYLAIEQRKLDLADLREDGRRRGEEIDDQFAEQKRIADRRYREQLDAAKAAADKAIRLEQEKARAEINEKVRAYNEQIAALTRFTNQGTTLVYDFVNDTLIGLAHLVTQAKSLLASAVIPGGIGAAVGGVLSGEWWYGKDQGFPKPTVPQGGWGNGGIGAPLGFNYGGSPSSSSFGADYAFNEAARRRSGGFGAAPTQTAPSIFSPALTQRMLQGGAGGLTINLGGVHGSQLGKRDVLRLVDKQLSATLDDAGWK